MSVPRETHSSSHSFGSVGLEISPTARTHAQRHLQRAQEHIKLKTWNLAVQELRDAIAIDPFESSYHALMAKIYLSRGMTSMANVSLRQALKLNPQDTLALECQEWLQKQEAKGQRQGGLAKFWGGLFGDRK